MEESNLSRLEQDLIMKADVCSSWGAIGRFPAQLTRPFHTYGVGLIVCDQGEFHFSLDSRNYSAHAGETVFLPADVLFQIQDSSDDLVAYVLIYKVEPIRDIVGNVAQSLRLYSNLSPDKYYVWQTGEEKNVVRYMRLLEKSPETQEEPFDFYERKLLLLSLTYRLCSIFHRKLMAGGNLPPPDLTDRPILYVGTGCRILCRQTVPVAQIPVGTFQINLRLYGTRTRF